MVVVLDKMHLTGVHAGIKVKSHFNAFCALSLNMRFKINKKQRKLDFGLLHEVFNDSEQ